jgi:putative salt-induced outer membrane protein YdiY
VKFRAIVWTLACVAVALSARADVVEFQNGDKLSGKVVSLSDGKLKFASDLAGTLSIDWSKVATFTTDGPVTIQFPDGQTLVDKVTRAEPGSVQTVGTASVSPQTVVLANAVKLNPEPVHWAGMASAGAAFDRGNSHRTAMNAAFDAVRRSEFDRITFGAGWITEKTTDTRTLETVTGKRSLFGALQYDLFFTKKWYGLAGTKAEKDGVAGLSLRLTTGVGAGYQFIETDELKINVELGPTWVSENYSNDTPDTDYVAARVAWNVDWLITPGLSFFHHGRALPSLQRLNDQLFDTATGLRYKLWGNFFGESKVLFVWDTTPAEGRKQHDLSYILGVGYSF